MTNTVRAACVQITSISDPAQNRVVIAEAVRKAAEQGARLITLPENADCMGLCRDNLLAASCAEDGHPTLALMSQLACETATHILLGSIAVQKSVGVLANRSYFFAPDGRLAARYDKIHLFDSCVDGVSYRESDRYEAGREAVVVDSPWGGIGLSICYDVRFPQLYRALAKAGAAILTVPAAFIVPTGKKHWHVLLRSRAIETGCFVIAPAQCGQHGGGRESYGHSLIIAPDGTVMAEAGDQPQIIMADLNLDAVKDSRKSLACLQHDREFRVR